MVGWAERPISRVANTLDISGRGGWLWCVVVVTAALDAATTTIGIEAGLSEGNPVVSLLLDTIGITGLIGVQLAFVAGVTVLVSVANRYREHLLGWAAVVGLFPVVNNVLAIGLLVGIPTLDLLFLGKTAAICVFASVGIGSLALRIGSDVRIEWPPNLVLN